MKYRRLLALFSASLFFFTSCNKETFKDKLIEQDEQSLHVGGDETNDDNYKFIDSSTFQTTTLTVNNNSIKCVIDPQSSSSFLSTTTNIYNVDLSTFATTNIYKQGYTTILYTPDFYFSNTTTTNDYNEYIATFTNGSYQVCEIYEKGSSYIPLNGVVLAVPKSINVNIEIGDTLSICNDINRYDYALKNQDNIRIPFNSVNNYRDANEVVLYDRYYGNYTKTNQYGCEIYVKYDFSLNTFVVKGFRGHNKVLGDLNQNHLTYGGYIPLHGFVISAHQNAINYDMYRQGRKFNIDDQVIFENYSFNKQLDNATLELYRFNNLQTRPSNHIIKYTNDCKYLDEYGYTNFNLYEAIEIAVVPISDYGVVVAMDREVGCPKNGYLLSANGTGAQALKQYVKLGSLIKLTEDNKIIINNDVALGKLTNLEYYKNLLLNKQSTGKYYLYDYDYTNLSSSINDLINLQNTIQLLKDESDESDDVTLKFENDLLINQLYIEATNKYYLGYAFATESNYVEARAAWLWAIKCNSLDEVKFLVNRYKETNINLIYLSIFDGTTCFSSQYVPYDSTFAGNFGEYGKNNFLKAFVEECHKVGIEVHGWTTNFHVGTVGKSNTLFNKYPEWQQVYYDGKTYSDDDMTEKTLLYFDQANPDVHQFLADFYNELLDNVDLDGLHLDYIRYAAGNDVGKPDSIYCKISSGNKLHEKECLNRTTGYTEYAMNDFLSEYGYSSDTDMKELIKTVSIYDKWSKYRANKITSFVEKIYNEVYLGRDIDLSMAIVPEVEHALTNKMQDWTTWVDNGWIDTVNGMYYSPDSNRVSVETNKIYSVINSKVYLYPGILVASYYELPPINDIYSYEAAKTVSDMGASIFDAQGIWSYQRAIYSNSNYDLKTLLINGNHRNAAVLPHDDINKVMQAFINDISQKADNIYIKNDCMTQLQKESLINKLNSLNTSDYKNLISELKTLKNEMNNYASKEAINRINEYIDVIIYICECRIK